MESTTKKRMFHIIKRKFLTYNNRQLEDAFKKWKSLTTFPSREVKIIEIVGDEMVQAM